MTSSPKYPQPAHRLTRLMPHQKHDPADVRALPAGHAAITNSTTVFPTTKTTPASSSRLLVSGMNSRKIGAKITKGRWKDMPIFTLTLVERETCPTNCSNWLTCMGNNMHFARRHIAGPELENKLSSELTHLAEKHPKGFVVRLHVLGDFYSRAYACFWALQLQRHKNLHVFGFTAHHSWSDIGSDIEFMNWLFKDRCVIRFSKGIEPDPRAEKELPTAETIWVKPETPHRHNGGTVCPAQTDNTGCCGTCTLCWSPHAKHIVFIGHGHKIGPREKKHGTKNT